MIDAAPGAPPVPVAPTVPAPPFAPPTPPPAPPPAALAIARFDAWLETMRVVPAPSVVPAGAADSYGGYGGPVVHWWRDSLRYCGPGFDWRYEGVILGYLTLYRRTGRQRWLEKARRAGDDLLAAQSATGHFAHSGFELNPTTAGTPHEAAADIGLLALAAELKRRDDPAWTGYLEAARLNLRRCYVERLWDNAARRFCDDEAHTSFVPNKAATTVEALFDLVDLTGNDELVERYARPTLDAVLRYQVRRPGDALDGGIAQNSLGRAVVETYFPYYVARCIPALVRAHTWYGDARYLDGAFAAGAFVLRWRDPDGAFPQVVYPKGRVNRFPRWVGGLGDILRALELLRPHGLTFDATLSRCWLLDRQLANGSLRPAEGFAGQVSQRPPAGPPDARDLFPVVGWADKAFRYLAGDAGVRDVPEDGGQPAAVESACRFFGQPAVFREDDTVVEVARGRTVLYRWRKGETWAHVEPHGGVK